MLSHERRLCGVQVERQVAVAVHYRGVVVGHDVADRLVARQVVVEIKATREHHDVFTAQRLNHLRATGLPVCLLLNFGRLHVEVRRYRADRRCDPLPKHHGDQRDALGVDCERPSVRSGSEGQARRQIGVLAKTAAPSANRRAVVPRAGGTAHRLFALSSEWR